jgi:hypothetical protein
MRRFLYFLREFGLDPVRTVNAFRELPWFIGSYIRFRKIAGNNEMRLSPVLQDRRDSSGSADGHYFWQDLICAKWIFQENPRRHLDIGSRIDGFVAHLLSFREVEILDIRPPESEIPGLQTHVADAQNSLVGKLGQFDSVSSLHSIEHFGLGRYGDELDLAGHLKGLATISDLVAPKGHLYLSYPVGRNEIQFNAQRLLEHDWAPVNLPNFKIIQRAVIPWRGKPIIDSQSQELNSPIKGSCVLFQFQRIE